MQIYTVRPGDTLYSIAARFSLNPQELARLNMLSNPSLLTVGQGIVLPIGNYYTVTPGDSLYTIALQHGVSLDELIRFNSNLTPPYIISPGQQIALPETEKRAIDVLGYISGNITDQVLTNTLPYLTYLAIFSYSVNYNGTLTPPYYDDTSLIERARNSNVAPLLVLTNTIEGEGFSSDLVRTVLTDEGVRTSIINEAISTCLSKGYYGVNVDFEYVYPDDREAYNNFLELFERELSRNGLSLSTAIAPKLSATQQGTLYEAHDYAFHGEVVNFTVIMTYEWGYTYGPPMAVAPYDQVRRVISYATTEIPSNKILMGMPNYGYDWTLPYEEGTAARSLTINGALNLAQSVGAEIQFNEASQAPFFEYYRDGRRHIVWFENARSTAARLQLVNDYNLRGVSYWTINSFFPQNWLVLEGMFDINKVI